MPEDRHITAADVLPAAEVRPDGVEGLGLVLAGANDAGKTVLVCGGGTKLGWGAASVRADLLLNVSDLCGFSELDPDNLTLSVAAGTPVGEVAERAKSIGRLFPLDPGTPARATVGGVVATGDQGARGAGYGGVRDVVLGMKAVLADGTSVKFGGRTMKNVTGYDLTRLFIGSFGVLGIITEVTFRLLPRPSRQAVIALPLATLARAGTIAARIVASPLFPLCVEVVSPGFAHMVGSSVAGLTADSEDSSGCLLLAGFAGHPAAVARSLADVGALCRDETLDGRAQTIWWDDEAETVYAALAEARAAALSAGLPVAARVAMPQSEVWAMAEAFTATEQPGGIGPVYRLGAARGTLDLYAAPDQGPQALSDRLALLRRQATPAGGYLVVTQGLAELDPGFEPWGDAGPSLRVMRALKQRFDPRGTLNCGRYVGGM